MAICEGAGPGVGRAAALQVWSAYDITKARCLEIKLYGNKQKIISLDRTVGELKNTAGSRSNILRSFLEQQAGAALVLHGETFHMMMMMMTTTTIPITHILQFFHQYFLFDLAELVSNWDTPACSGTVRQSNSESF